MRQARINLDEYTTRVLDVVKGRYGLKNREDALNKFVREFGEEFVEPQVNENKNIPETKSKDPACLLNSNKGVIPRNKRCPVTNMKFKQCCGKLS